jgi:hypothetical protein
MRQGKRRERVITLYECPPLHARLSARQCAANRERARAAMWAGSSAHKWRSPLVAPTGPRACASCPGVLRFARESGRAPYELAAGELVRAHAESEERRQRMRIAPDEPAASAGPLRLEDVAALFGLGRSL